MNSVTSISQYFANASALDIADWLMAIEAPELGHVALRDLLANEPAKANSVLCHVYDVACYQVGGSCFAEGASAEDRDKWFVSVISGTFNDVDTAPIPLAESLVNAEALAVKHLRLQDLFFEVNPLVALEQA